MTLAEQLAATLGVPVDIAAIALRQLEPDLELGMLAQLGSIITGGTGDEPMTHAWKAMING